MKIRGWRLSGPGSTLRVARQEGSILLVLLVAMAAGSSLFVYGLDDDSAGERVDIVLGQGQGSGSGPAYRASPWVTLTSARRHLLAYAADYASLYGPTGAGPGHLPCPDTDPRPLYRQPDDWRLAGPNPPCAALPVPWGRLPAHVAFGADRYRIQASVHDELWYAVSAAFINNPIDRPVRPGTPGTLSIDGQPGFAAVVIQPPRGQPPHPTHRDGDGRFSRATDDRVIGLRAHTVTTTSAQRVELWLADRMASQPAPASAPQCRQALSALADQGLDTQQQSADVVPIPVAALLIENVPSWRHWLVRNGWLEHIGVQCDTGCWPKAGPGAITRVPSLHRQALCRWELAHDQAGGWTLLRVPE